MNPSGSDQLVTISSLPPELLTEIFDLARPKLRPLHKLPFEVVLSHVSSSWRSYALAMRVLWRKIDIYSIRSLDRLTHYLQRSGTQLSLDIYIDLYKEDRFISFGFQRKREMVQLIANAVLPHIHRARSLFIFACYEHTSIMLLSNFINSSAPELKTLRMAFGHLSTTGVRGPGIRVFNSGLPQLTFLETDLPDCLPPLALQNLTTLHLHSLSDSLNLSYRSFVAMITAPPYLSHLSLQGSMDIISTSDSPSHSSWPGFVMSHLKSLRVQDGGMFALRILLLMFAPNLESLWLDYSFSNFGHLFDAPHVTQPNRFPALKYLTIPTYGFSRYNNISRVFPTITHLHLPHANFYRDDRLADFLLGHWRYLHTLIVDMIRESQSSGFHGALRHILPYRRNAGYPIKKLLVDEDLFRALKKEGSDILGEVDIELLGLDTYREPWWVMSHERRRMDGF